MSASFFDISNCNTGYAECPFYWSDNKCYFFVRKKEAVRIQTVLEIKNPTSNQIYKISGGITMAIAAGIIAVSGIISFELEKHAPSVLADK